MCSAPNEGRIHPLNPLGSQFDDVVEEQTKKFNYITVSGTCLLCELLSSNGGPQLLTSNKEQLIHRWDWRNWECMYNTVKLFVLVYKRKLQASCFEHFSFQRLYRWQELNSFWFWSQRLVFHLLSDICIWGWTDNHTMGMPKPELYKHK